MLRPSSSCLFVGFCVLVVCLCFSFSLCLCFSFSPCLCCLCVSFPVALKGGPNPKTQNLVPKISQEALFALQRLGYPNRRNSLGRAAGEKESLLVGCSWSGR